MKKKIFFRFFSVIFLSVLLMFVFSLVAVKLNAQALIKERLQQETELACNLCNDVADFKNFDKYQNDNTFRITICDIDGTVLYESDTKTPLENHLDREEIQNAINGVPATVERYSQTFGCQMTYFAMKTTLNDNREVILRLAVRSSEISSYIGVAVPLLVVVLIVALFASIGISALLSKNISKKIVAVGASIKSLNDGKYQPIETDTSEPEFYSLLTEINELSEKTLFHIKNMEYEHKKLNAVLDNVTQGIIAVNKEKNIVFYNKSIEKTFNVSIDLKGKEIIYLIDDIKLCERIINHVGESYSFEVAFDGRDFLVDIVPTLDEQLSSEIANIIIFTDITSEKVIARQKSDFFANASHELKTPVTVLQGLSEILLSKDSLDLSSKKQIERINKESLRLASLITDMLKLSKLERGEETELTVDRVNLREVCDEVLSELANKIGDKNITVSISGNGEIKAESKKIFEIAENLISNAVRYNKENGTINVEIIEDESNVILKVADTGIGIAKEHIPFLCERFYMVDKSRSANSGGTGLGLAIVKHICALYKAELIVESELNVGTTVTVIFNK